MWSIHDIIERPKLDPKDNVKLLYKRCHKNIDDVIEEYKCKIVNSCQKEYWKECLRIAKKIKNK